MSEPDSASPVRPPQGRAPPETATLPPDVANGSREPAEAETLAPSPAEPGPEPLTVVGAYEILGELGRGGMGVVYKARQKGLNRLVALKMVLAGGHAAPEDLARFRLEAEAVARLRHPNIVQVYEVGEHNGLPYFSLEYCDGGSLAQRLDGTPRPPAEAAGLTEVLARAVDAAHQGGIIHRDLKPGNILLSIADCRLPIENKSAIGNLQSAIPKITDFGLAKRLEADSGQTRSGSIVGTPSYMAPEQAAGKSKEVGPLADVYALGAILYELLTGRPPFRAATPLDTVLQVVAEEPVPPSRLAKLPRDLETICLKCLHKEPAKRYAGALALADDLRAFLDGRPIAARPVGRGERAWRWCRRNKALAAAAAAVAFALLAGSVVSTLFGIRATGSAEQARQAQRAAEGAQAQESRQREQAQQLARANHRQLTGVLVANGNRLVREGDPAGALPWLAEAVRQDPDDSVHANRLDGVLGLVPRPVFFWQHKGPVNHIAVSPDGRRAATASDDGTARIWDLETGLPVGPPLVHDTPVLAVAFSPDGRRLATATGAPLVTGGARLWDAASGQLLGPPFVYEGLVPFVGLTAEHLILAGLVGVGGKEKMSFTVCDPAGAKVIGRFETDRLGPELSFLECRLHAATHRLVLAEDKQARVVDLATGKILGEPIVHEQPISWAQLSHDGTRAITIDIAGGCKVRDIATGKERPFVLGYGWGSDAVVSRVARGPAVDAAINERGELVLALSDGAVQRYRLSDGKPVPDSRKKLGTDGWQPRFSADAAFLVSRGKDATVRAWEVDSGQPLSPWLRHGTNLRSIAVAAEGRRLLVAGDDHTVRVWDLAMMPAEQPTRILSDIRADNSLIGFDDAGHCLLVGNGTLHRFDPATGRRLGTLQAKWDPSERTVALSRDGRRLVVRNNRGEGRVLDTASLQPLGPFLKHGRRFVLDAVFSPDGRCLLTRAADSDWQQTAEYYLGEAQLWDLTTGRPILPEPLRAGTLLERGGITCIAYSPDGHWFAAGSGQATLRGVRGQTRVYDAATGKPVGAVLPSAPGGGPTRIAFSPDSNLIAVLSNQIASPAGDLAVWDFRTGRAVLPTAQLTAAGGDCDFDPVTGRLAVADGTGVQIWDPAAGRLVHVLPHQGVVRTVRYQAGGRILLIVVYLDTAPGSVAYLWDAATGEELRPPVRHPGGVQLAAVSPDGRYLVHQSGFVLGQITVWDLTADPARREQRDRLARLLSCQEIHGAAPAPVPADRLAADWQELHRHRPDPLAPTAAMIAQWYDRQGMQLAGAESWHAAARQFDRVPGPAFDDPWHLYIASACYLECGRRDGARRMAEEMLRRHRDSTNLYLIDWTVKACLVAPGTLANPAPAVRLAERLEKTTPADGAYAWFVLTRGMALYRAGDLEGASRWLEKFRALPGRPALPGLLGDLLLAMTRKRQGRVEEARKLLAEATRALEALEKQPWSGGGHDRVHARAVLREAEREIGQR